MLTRQEIKQRAKEQIKGNIGISFLCQFIFLAILLALSSIPLLNIITVWVLFFILSPLSLGLQMVYMEISYGRKPDVSTLFSGFGQYGQSMLAYLLLLIPNVIYNILTLISFCVLILLTPFSAMTLNYDVINNMANAFILYFIWSTFLSIIFCCIMLGFSMIYQIMAEQPDLSGLDVLKASWQMMKGRRWNYVVFHLSFFLWHCLGVITLGFAYIYITPYLMTANAHYYHNIKADQNIFPVGREEPIKQGEPVSHALLSEEIPVMNQSLDSVEIPVVNQSLDSAEIPAANQSLDSEKVPAANQSLDSEEMSVTNIASTTAEAPCEENHPAPIPDSPATSIGESETISTPEETSAADTTPEMEDAPTADTASVMKEVPATAATPETEDAPVADTASEIENSPVDEFEEEEEWSWENLIKK